MPLRTDNGAARGAANQRPRNTAGTQQNAGTTAGAQRNAGTPPGLFSAQNPTGETPPGSVPEATRPIFIDLDNFHITDYVSYTGRGTSDNNPNGAGTMTICGIQFDRSNWSGGWQPSDQVALEGVINVINTQFTNEADRVKALTILLRIKQFELLRSAAISLRGLNFNVSKFVEAICGVLEPLASNIRTRREVIIPRDTLVSVRENIKLIKSTEAAFIAVALAIAAIAGALYRTMNNNEDFFDALADILKKGAEITAVGAIALAVVKLDEFISKYGLTKFLNIPLFDFAEMNVSVDDFPGVTSAFLMQVLRNGMFLSLS